MKTFTHALAHGTLLLIALSFAGGCESNTGLAGTTGSNMGSAGASSMGAAGAGSTGNAGTTASGAAGTAPGGAAGGGGGAGENDTIPAGWTGAQVLMIQQTPCIGEAAVPPPFVVTEAGGVFEGALKCVGFREFQSLCGYVVDGGATTRVLVQPCDLHPTGAALGDGYAYNVTFGLPARTDRSAVEIYERFDFYGATTPPVPMLLARATVGAGDDAGSSMDGGVD